jgi:non-haem dioxygenase in morphine synthesis N-terminal
MTSESTVTDDFTSIPILNYALLSSPDTRPVFIRQLQHALIDVGFLYLENTPVPDDALFDEVIAYLPRIFALPQERKDALRMVNSPHFLGYSRLGVERTRGAADQREQFDFATPFENEEWVPELGQPEYVRLWGPSQVSVFFLLLLLNEMEFFESAIPFTVPYTWYCHWHFLSRPCQYAIHQRSSSVMDDRDQLILINDHYHRRGSFSFFKSQWLLLLMILIDD